MQLNGKLLARARSALGAQKIENEQMLRERRSEVFARIPGVRETERKLSRLMINVSLGALDGEKDVLQAVAEAQAKCAELEAQLKKQLSDAGYPEDCIDEKYSCPGCSDTGYIGGKICDCLKELYDLELARDLSSLPGYGDECFENFDLSYYSSVRSAGGGYSPREGMETVYSACKEYSGNFGKNSVNLLFQGNTGLGKTYLSVCIARRVAASGYSVMYDTAVGVLAQFETQRFSRNTEGSFDADEQIRRYIDCDLLIIDDLGTEMPGSFTASALYTLLNTRLISGKKMVVSTNLCFDELAKRYTPQIVSRLEGEFLNLAFSGEDIRAIKKEQGLNG